MKRTCLLVLVVLFECGWLQAAALKTGIHLSIPVSFPAYQYLILENGDGAAGTASTSVRKLAPLIEQNFSLFLSTFKENLIEFNLGLSKEKYRIEENGSPLDRYLFSFELGKLFSYTWSDEKGRLISPDIGIGAFAILSIFARKPYNNFYFQYGLYGTVKIKLNFLARPLRLSSFDCGYRYQLPIHDGLYPQETRILSSRHFLFVGITF